MWWHSARWAARGSSPDEAANSLPPALEAAVNARVALQGKLIRDTSGAVRHDPASLLPSAEPLTRGERGPRRAAQERWNGRRASNAKCRRHASQLESWLR